MKRTLIVCLLISLLTSEVSLGIPIDYVIFQQAKFREMFQEVTQDPAPKDRIENAKVIESTARHELTSLPDQRALVLLGLASFYASVQDLARADALLEEALTITAGLKEVFPEAYWNVAQVGFGRKMVLKQRDKAKALLVDVTRVVDQSYGKNSMATAITLEQLAGMHAQVGNAQEANRLKAAAQHIRSTLEKNKTPYISQSYTEEQSASIRGLIYEARNGVYTSRDDAIQKLQTLGLSELRGFPREALAALLGLADVLVDTPTERARTSDLLTAARVIIKPWEGLFPNERAHLMMLEGRLLAGDGEYHLAASRFAESLEVLNQAFPGKSGEKVWLYVEVANRLSSIGLFGPSAQVRQNCIFRPKVNSHSGPR